MGKKFRFLMTSILFLAFSSPIFAQDTLVSFKSQWGRFLQAHTDGEMHASNENRGQEETWKLVEVDPSRHIIGLKNYRTNNFLCKDGPRNYCTIANRPNLLEWEQFELISGGPYGFPNKVALKSLKDGMYLATNAPGEDNDCGGEVGSFATPQFNNGGWAGYWEMEVAPQPGGPFCDGPLRTFCRPGTWIKIAEVAYVVCQLTGYCP